MHCKFGDHTTSGNLLIAVNSSTYTQAVQKPTEHFKGFLESIILLEYLESHLTVTFLASWVHLAAAFCLLIYLTLLTHSDFSPSSYSPGVTLGTAHLVHWSVLTPVWLDSGLLKSGHCLYSFVQPGASHIVDSQQIWKVPETFLKSCRWRSPAESSFLLPVLPPTAWHAVISVRKALMPSQDGHC